jgi:hypothetical protein
MLRPSFSLAKSIASLAAASTASLSLSGCIVPDVAPMLTGVDEQNLMAAVIRGVQCEIRRAVKAQIHEDPRLKWLFDWSAIINLQLSFKNMASFNPGVSLNTPMIPANPYFPGGVTFPVMQSYSLGLGGNASFSGTRTEIVDYYYDFRDLKNSPDEPTDTERCYHLGRLSIIGNLDLNSWFRDALAPIKQCAFEGRPVEINDDLPEEEAVEAYKRSCKHLRNPITTLSHQIDFELIFGGSITPTWTLVRVSTPASPANIAPIGGAASPLFGAQRADHSTLLMTLGPANEAPKDYVSSGKVLGAWGSARTVPSAAMQARNSSLMIGAAVKDSLR